MKYLAYGIRHKYRKQLSKFKKIRKLTWCWEWKYKSL